MQPNILCPRCGSENTAGATACRICGIPFPPSLRLPGKPEIPPTPKISKPLKINPPPPIPPPKEITGDKRVKVTKEKDQETEQNGLNERALKAQIRTAKAQKATAWILGVTLAIAIVAGFVAYKQYRAVYNQYEAAYNDYQARTRPYLVIQELQFYEMDNGYVYLLIDVTNSGERPATNINIQEIQVCVVSENPLNQCKPLEWTIEGGEKETILYPGRINTSRIYIDKNDYRNIEPTDKIIVSIEYGCGEKEYSYEASLRLRPNSDVWRIESEKGN